MRFNPVALLVFVVFAAALAFVLNRGFASMHLAEAAVTVIILLSLLGLGLRNTRQRSR